MENQNLDLENENRNSDYEYEIAKLRLEGYFANRASLAFTDILNKLIDSMVEETKKVEREYIRLLSKYDSDMINKIISLTNCSIFDVEDYINRVQFTKDGFFMIDFASLSDLHFEESNQSNNQDRITQLKSQLKHCKNLLQKLNIEREMNRLIRERGRR